MLFRQDYFTIPAYFFQFLQNSEDNPTVNTVEYSIALVTKTLFEQFALERIQQNGFRITNTRVQVIRILAKATYSLTAYQVHELVKAEGNRIDVVSIYRILDFLHDLDLVFKVGIAAGYFPKRLAAEKNIPTFVFIDQDSNTIQELPLPDSVIHLIRTEASKAGFNTDKLVVETSGSVQA